MQYWLVGCISLSFWGSGDAKIVENVLFERVGSCLSMRWYKATKQTY